MSSCILSGGFNVFAIDGISVKLPLMPVKVSPKYQVVIPEEARRSLAIKPGSSVDVIVKGGIAYLVPVVKVEEIQKRLRGKKISSTGLREKKDRL